MSIEIKVPVLPESVSDATIVTWHKKTGEPVKCDEHLLDVETDKIILEVVAPQDGFLENILKKEGETVKGNEVVALFSTSQATPLSPAARRQLEETPVAVEAIQGTGKKGRITAMDVEKAVTPIKPMAAEKAVAPIKPPVVVNSGERGERRVPMSRLRARIAERLLAAQQSAAILTTFNEVNMQPVMQLRQKYKEIFEKDYGVRLGFMSFFTLAVVEALKKYPMINASVENQDIIYHDYYDIGIAIASPRGLVVPILRNAESLHMAEIEQKIAEFSEKAKNGQLSLEDMEGGTFTISNGGVFGSLMSTPILNPPQSAILGMHKIEERPVVEGGQVVIRPMMYLAMSYDHRIIDGAESVRFLVAVKEFLEDPARLLLNV